MAQHELRFNQSADWIERHVQMEDEMLRFTFTAQNPYAVGDGVIVTSTDKCIFIGEVAEVDPETGIALISLS